MEQQLYCPQIREFPLNDLICIGLDLAWSPRNPTGAAVIQAEAGMGQLRDVKILGNDAAIVAYILDQVQEKDAIVAVDAPLWVPNTTGRRPAEAELTQVFRRYQAGTHPANRQRLVFEGVVRGEYLCDQLNPYGFHYGDRIEVNQKGRCVIEVFPHAAMVSLFHLDRILRYKAKPKRSLQERQQEWQRYQAYVKDLATQDPALQGQEDLVNQDITLLKGKKLKDYEDQMDAVICAYTALYGWRWGSKRCRTFGDWDSGSIFTPVPVDLWGSQDCLGDGHSRLPNQS